MLLATHSSKIFDNRPVIPSRPVTRKRVDLMDLIGASAVADLLDIAVTHVYALHKRDTDGFASLRLETADSNLWLYSEKDVRQWATKTGRLDTEGNPVRRRPGRRATGATTS